VHERDVVHVGEDGESLEAATEIEDDRVHGGAEEERAQGGSLTHAALALESSNIVLLSAEDQVGRRGVFEIEGASESGEFGIHAQDLGDGGSLRRVEGVLGIDGEDTLAAFFDQLAGAVDDVLDATLEVDTVLATLDEVVGDLVAVLSEEHAAGEFDETLAHGDGAELGVFVGWFARLGDGDELRFAELAVGAVGCGDAVVGDVLDHSGDAVGHDRAVGDDGEENLLREFRGAGGDGFAVLSDLFDHFVLVEGNVDFVLDVSEVPGGSDVAALVARMERFHLLDDAAALDVGRCFGAARGCDERREFRVAAVHGVGEGLGGFARLVLGVEAQNFFDGFLVDVAERRGFWIIEIGSHCLGGAGEVLCGSAVGEVLALGELVEERGYGVGGLREGVGADGLRGVEQLSDEFAGR